MHYWTIYCATPGLTGTITCPIVFWRAFFILFHHFIDKIYVYIGDLSFQVTMLYLVSAKQFDEQNVHGEVVTTYFITKI